MIRNACLALTALLAAACAPAAEAKPPIWVVKDADSEIVLFGSVHVLPPGLDWRPERLAKKVEAGAEVKIGEVVAVIDTAVTDAPSAPAPKAAPATAAKAAPAAPVSAPDKPTSDAVSPAVRRLAAETGIDPAAVTGTGKAGRVTKGDLLAAAEAKLARVCSLLGEALAVEVVPRVLPTFEALREEIVGERIELAW